MDSTDSGSYAQETKETQWLQTHILAETKVDAMFREYKHRWPEVLPDEITTGYTHDQGVAKE